MRASVLSAVLFALSGAPSLVHAAPQAQESTASDSDCTCTCAACQAKHGTPKAKEASVEAKPEVVELVELGRVLDEINAANAEPAQDEREVQKETERATAVLRALETELSDVDSLLAEPTAVQQETKDLGDAERAEAVLRALETDLSEVEALLVESMEKPKVVEGKPALQALGYGGNVELDDVTEGVQVRLVDVSDSGAPVLLPVDVRDPKPSADDRGYMGVMVRDGDDGVTISSVVDGSPASQAGLEPEDIVFNVGGVSVVDMDGLVEAMTAYAAGDTVTVGIMRGKKPMRLRVTLGAENVARGAAPAPPAEPEPPTLREVEEEIAWDVEFVDSTDAAPRRIRLVNPDVQLGGIIEIEVDEEIVEEVEEVEWADHDEDECEEECEDCDEECGDECCGECGDCDDDCCGECEDDCDDECDDCGHDPLPEGYEEIYERRETRSSHNGHEEEEIFIRRERRPAHGHGHGHDEGVRREIEELHERIDRLEREIAELTDTLTAIRRELARRNPR